MSWARRLVKAILGDPGERARGDLACDPECLRLCIGDLVSQCESGPKKSGRDCAAHVMDSLDTCFEECCG